MIFCGSFHASATYLRPTLSALIRTHLWVVLGVCGCVGERRGEKREENVLCMTAPSHQLVFVVHEADGGVGEGFADCSHTVGSVEWYVVFKMGLWGCTFIASHFCAAIEQTWSARDAVGIDGVWERTSHLRSCRPRRGTSLDYPSISYESRPLSRKREKRVRVLVPLRSVETPVAKRPREATARDPPRSTIEAIVPPWRMLRRFFGRVVWLVDGL